MTEPIQPDPTPTPSPSKRISFLVVLVVVVAVATFLITALLTSIFERKQEAKNPYVRVVDVNEISTDPVPWGANWPFEFDTYKRTVDITRTRYGGSEAMPESRIERDPWLKRMYAGYAFSIDFRDRRGHAYMLYDQENTRRVLDKPQGGACMHCHASIIPTYRRVGLETMGKPADEAALLDFNWPAVMKGFEVMSVMTYAQAHAELLKTPDGTPGENVPLFPGGSSTEVPTPANLDAKMPAPTTQHALMTQDGEGHPVSCLDCHNPKTMALRVTRPGFINGIRALATAKEADPQNPDQQRFVPVPHLPSVERWREGNMAEPYDPNTMATRQEMRSFACGQCHVEYYCATKETLFFPWQNGLKVQQIEKTYDNHKFPDGTPFMDFKQGITGAPVYKAQHPEFEMWSQGIHARAGVSCADCHMPYERQGATKVSSHWVRSPLLSINRSCQTCHNVPEDELKARVLTIQDRTHDLIQRSGSAVDEMLTAVRDAKASGASEADMAKLYQLQRSSQWRLDFVVSENSMGFHADQESARILAESIDYARQAVAMATGLRASAPAKSTEPIDPIKGVTPTEKAPAGAGIAPQR